MKKQISTTIGILIIVLVAGVAGAGVLFFNQEKEEIFVELEKELVAWEKGKRIIIPVEDFSNFEEVILHYLNKYPNNEEVLDDLFFDFHYDERKSAEENKWKEIPESRSENFIEKLVKKTGKADIKGDGKEELIIVFTDPYKFQSFHKPGWGEFVYLSVFSYNNNNKYSLEFLSESDFFRNLSFMDIDNNGKEEIIFVNYSCGMHTCSIGVRGIHFSKGNWKYIIESNSISVSTPDSLMNDFEEIIKKAIKWEDVIGDDRKELLISGGGFCPTIGTCHEAKKEIYKFDEEKNKYQLMVEDNYFNLAGAKADGYYIEQLADFYPALLEKAINSSNLSSLEVFFGNEDVAKEHEKLVKTLQEKGSNFKVDDFTFSHDNLFEQQEVKIILSYTNKDKEEDQTTFNYFFKFEETKDDHEREEAVIVEMTEQ